MSPNKTVFAITLFFAFFILSNLSACSNSKHERQSVTIDVLMEKEGSGIFVDYLFHADTDGVEFQINSNVDRRTSWENPEEPAKVIADSFKLENETKKRFRFSLSQNVGPIDRIYPSLINFTNNVSVINLDYVIPKSVEEGGVINLSNTYNVKNRKCEKSEQIKLNEIEMSENAIGRYVVISRSFTDCQEFAQSNREGVFTSSSIPSAIKKAVIGLVQKYVPAFAKELNYYDIESPFILVWHNENAVNGQWQGDAGWNSMIFLRFYGSNWIEPDAISDEMLSNFVSHELVHLWLGKKFQIVDAAGNQNSWLTEGAAEYLSLKQMAKQGEINDASFKSRVESEINSCVTQLWHQSLLTERRPIRGRLIYSCGILVHFLLDTNELQKTQGDRDIHNILDEALSNAQKNNQHYINEDELLSRDLGLREGLQTLLYGPDVDVDRIVLLMNNLGLDADSVGAKDEPLVIQKTLFYLLRNHCETDSYGYYIDQELGTIELDTSNRCGSMKEGANVDLINNIRIIDDPSGVLNTIVEQCVDSSNSIVFSSKIAGSIDFKVDCPAEKIFMMQEIKINHWGYFDDH